MDVFYHATETTAALAKSKGCKVTFTVAKGIDTVKGDVTLLKQLVRNLVENSIIYSDSGSKVSLEAKEARDGELIKIIVSDTGFGISEEDLSRVSEKFFRGSNASKTKGTGLGLPLCKDIAEMHGGSLKVKSVLGKGTTVTVKIRRGINK
jgi:two-component system cell cycle sensor histidine kinase PleC